jgi:hypothetical protein
MGMAGAAAPLAFTAGATYQLATGIMSTPAKIPSAGGFGGSGGGGRGSGGGFSLPGIGQMPSMFQNATSGSFGSGQRAVDLASKSILRLKDVFSNKPSGAASSAPEAKQNNFNGWTA